jgi:hypothetical protein
MKYHPIFSTEFLRNKGLVGMSQTLQGDCEQFFAQGGCPELRNIHQIGGLRAE